MSHTIAVDVKLVNAGVEVSSPENQDGNPQDTRKNPHVIVAGFEPGLLVNCWYITLMAISTMLM
jgi:hypothetical protein